MNRLFFLMFLTLLTSTVYSQTNGLNVYGGEIKTIAMGNQNVSISNYYFPEDQFKVYVQEFIDEISLSAENKNVLLDSLSALADQNTSLTESVEYYEKYVRFLEAKVRELDIQIQAATNNYLQLSREVIAGTGNLISSGYDVISVEDAGTIRYAFDKEKIINDPSLLILFEFNNGIAIAKKSNKYGVVNISGQLITDIKYDYVEQFSCDLALVKNHSRYGYINVRGKEVIDLKYIEAKSFSNDYAS
ncbi:MAG: WG repeat-containing protein, partial [Cyanobacteria bacterium J06649_11]